MVQAGGTQGAGRFTETLAPQALDTSAGVGTLVRTPGLLLKGILFLFEKSKREAIQWTRGERVFQVTHETSLSSYHPFRLLLLENNLRNLGVPPTRMKRIK